MVTAIAREALKATADARPWCGETRVFQRPDAKLRIK
jgi:hypothetical protein